MSVVGRSKGLSAWFTALAVLFALVVPFAGTALAAHDVSADPEPIDTTAGTQVSITVDGAAGDEIDFEIDCVSNCTGATYTIGTPSNAGGPISTPDTPTDGDQTPQAADDTRTSPELSCTISGGGTCTVNYTRNNSGVDYVAAWHDADKSNATDESDPTELPSAEATAGTSDDGAQTEPDDTDVVEVNFAQLLPGSAKLDCDDDGAPGDINDTGGADNQNAPQGGNVTWTCLVWNDNGAGGGTANNGIRDGGEQGLSGVNIDLEIQGPNDPDNFAFGTGPGGGNATPDVNNACTTGGDGTCTVNRTQTENESGLNAIYCFWADADNDNQYDPAGTQQDGEECDDEGVNDAEGDDLTDLVLVNWVTGGQATVVDAEPEYQVKTRGQQVTIDVFVADALGAAVANAPVDVIIWSGRNSAQGLICDNKLTGADGHTTCTYTDSNAIIPIGGTETDLVYACTSTGPGNNCPIGDNVDDPERDDTEDAVQVNFYNSAPTVDQIEADADANTDYPNNDCDGDYDAADTHGVNVVNVICADLLPGVGSPDNAGTPVTFTITSGPGYFFEDWDESETENASNGTEPQRGNTITVNADNFGDAFALFNSQQAGQATIQIQAGGQTATVTKTVTGQPPRNIACSPDTAETPAGGSRTFSCTVTDRFGQPSTDALVGLIESGPGSTGPTNSCRNFDVIGIPTVPAAYAQCQATNSQGVATFTVTSTPEEEGTQTLIFEIVRWTSPNGAPACPGADDCGDSENPGTADPANDINDPCDHASGRLSQEEGGASDNADATGQGPAPAGNCEDTSTNDWVQPDTACDDGADNDGDGFVDFPDDPGCDSDADDSEEPFNEPDPTKTFHPRNINIKFDHSGRDRLVIFGDLDAPGFPDCHKQQIVKVQRRANKRWVTKKTTSTNGKGKYAVEINDAVSRYRAVAPKSKNTDLSTNHSDVCNKTTAAKKHNHKN